MTNHSIYKSIAIPFHLSVFVHKFGTTFVVIFCSLSRRASVEAHPWTDSPGWQVCFVGPLGPTLHTRLYLPFRFCCTGCPVIFGPLSLSLLIVKCHQLRLAGWWCDSTKSQLSIRLFTLLAFVRHATSNRRDTPPTHTHTHTHIYKYVHTHIYIYIYIHTYT